MRYFFKFPDIGEGITEGKILQWYVEKGNQIKVGEPVVNMETDKVVTDIPSPKSGTIVAVFGKVGEVINVEDPLVEIEIEGVEGEEAVKASNEIPEKRSEEILTEDKFGVVGSLEVAGDGAFLPASGEGHHEEKSVRPKRKKALATPVARAMARDMNVDINIVPGTGPGGRVMKKDIKDFSLQGDSGEKTAVENMSSIESTEILDISQIRKAIARNMSLSKLKIPHMSVFEEVEISQLVSVRSRLKGRFSKDGMKITFLSFIVKAVAKSLKDHKFLNGRFDPENGTIIVNNNVNIGIAVDTPDGLVVPVIRDADKKNIKDIAVNISELAKKAENRSLVLGDLSGGTFTITNFGSIGGIHAVPIINYPQSAILGVGRILDKPVVADGLIVPGKILPLSLTVDHRIVDGGESARFINKVREYLAEPVTLAIY